MGDFLEFNGKDVSDLSLEGLFSEFDEFVSDRPYLSEDGEIGLDEDLSFLKEEGDDISIEDIDAFDDWASNHPMMQGTELEANAIEDDSEFQDWLKDTGDPELNQIFRGLENHPWLQGL